MVVPFVRRLALGLRQGLLGLERVVDDDQVGSAAGQHPANRGGDARALRRRLEFGYGLMARRQAGREEALVPVAGEDAPAIARELVGEVLGVADAEDLRTRLVAEAPGREGDRGEVRLQTARRQADDQPPDIWPACTAASFAAISSTCQFIANGGARVELANDVREIIGIVPRDDFGRLALVMISDQVTFDDSNPKLRGRS